MLEFFPCSAAGPNYWANHHVSMAINCGLTAGDAAAAFGPALVQARAGRHAGTPAFDDAIRAGNIAAARQLEADADRAHALGRSLSAGDAYLRATMLYELLDWYHWPWSSPDPETAGEYFRAGRRCFFAGVPLAHPRSRWVDVPFEGKALQGLLYPAAHPEAPVVIHVNGQHSSMHWQFLTGLPQMLASRGMSSLFFDHPGTGDARYTQGLMMRADTESYVGAAIDALEEQGIGQQGSIGLIGGSLGGYRVPRALAYEPRLTAGVAWGGHYEMYDSIRIDWPDVGRKLPLGGPFTESEQRIVRGLHYWAGTSTLEELDAKIDSLKLDGIMPRIKSALLVMHGADDVQLPAWHAERTHAEAVNAKQADLTLFRSALGGAQHCNWDNPRTALNQMSDWLADRLVGAART